MAAATKKLIQPYDLNWMYPGQVCELLGIDKRTLINWTKQEDDPCPSLPNDGTKPKIYPTGYEWPRVLAWYVRKEVNKDLRRLNSAPADAAEADFRNKAAAATIKEMKILQMQGELVESSKIADAWTNRILMAKKLLLAVSHKAAHALDDASTTYQQRRAVIGREIEAALTVLAGAPDIACSGSGAEDEEEEDDE